jgi:hypothetical protein
MGGMTLRHPRTLLVIASLGLALSLTACGDDEPAATPTPAASTAGGASSTAPPPSSEAPAGPTLELTVSGDTIDPANQQIDAKAGDTLVVEITSDRAGELHVHSSPEQQLEFKPGNTRLEIELKQPGQVDIEEHESDTLVARVLVK